MRRTKLVFLIVVVIFVVIQVIRPDFTNPPVDPKHTIQSLVTVPSNIDSTLRRACYDCHSYETRMPWYAQIAPVSWWLKGHINDGRKELNFSEFATYTKKRQLRKLDEACDEVKKGDMPLKTYVPMHPAAKLTDADRQMLCAWFQSVSR